MTTPNRCQGPHDHAIYSGVHIVHDYAEIKFSKSFQLKIFFLLPCVCLYFLRHHVHAVINDTDTKPALSVTHLQYTVYLNSQQLCMRTCEFCEYCIFTKTKKCEFFLFCINRGRKSLCTVSLVSSAKQVRNELRRQKKRQKLSLLFWRQNLLNSLLL